MPDIVKLYGPPGTGKTTKLISIVSDELASGVSPGQMVYVSFTKVAARVARDRALERFPEYSDSDFRHFSTVHSICYNLIGLHKENVFGGKEFDKFGKVHNYNFTQSEPNKGDPLAQTLQDMSMVTIHDYYEAFCNHQKNGMLEFDEAVRIFTKDGIPNEFDRGTLLNYIQRREAYKRENDLYDFPDMLLNVIEHDIKPANIKVLFIDEAQDNFPLLWEVIKMWVKGADRVYLTGDPYQCLYSWSGADPSLFINFAADKTMTLKQSYRCPREVHDLSRKIVSRFKLRYEDDDFIPRDADGSVIRVGQSKNVYDADFGLTDEPTFWLFRTRYLLNEVYDELYARGFPFRTRRGKTNIFNYKKNKKRIAVANLVNLHNKSINLADFGSIIDYIPSKLGDMTLIKRGSKKKINDDIKVFPDADVSWWDLRGLGFTDELIQHTGTSLLEFLAPKDFPAEEKSYIRRIVDKYGVSILHDTPKLELGTFHSVKGDEAAMVIIDPTYTRRPFENYMNGDDEEHRLIYTGITRSSRDVVIMPASRATCYLI